MKEAKILCIDDIQENLFTIKEVLKTHYKEDGIRDALSAKSAFDILLDSSFDLILLDIMMPDMDGYEVAKLLKSNKKTKEIPVIFLTAKKDDDTISRCFDVGGSDYISKPFNKDELISRVNFHIKLKKSIDELKKKSDFINAILDAQESLVVVVEDKKIVKSNKEFKKFFSSFKKDEIFDITRLKYEFLNTKDLHLVSLKDEDCWIEGLYKRQNNSDEVIKVSMMDTSEHMPKSFIVNVVKIDLQYVVSFTDITLLDIKLHKYENLATYDALTKICNRQSFNDFLKQTVMVANKTGLDFSLIMFDIDHFKLVNDTYGHLVGDKVLVHLSEIVKKDIRESDIFARWGGEEFMMILKGVRLELAKTIAENVRKKIESEDFDEIGKITCSFGVTSYKKGESIESLTKRVDEALYQAKERGRNQVCLM